MDRMMQQTASVQVFPPPNAPMYPRTSRSTTGSMMMRRCVAKGGPPKRSWRSPSTPATSVRSPLLCSARNWSSFDLRSSGFGIDGHLLSPGHLVLLDADDDDDGAASAKDAFLLPVACGVQEVLIGFPALLRIVGVEELGFHLANGCEARSLNLLLDNDL